MSTSIQGRGLSLDEICGKVVENLKAKKFFDLPSWSRTFVAIFSQIGEEAGYSPYREYPYRERTRIDLVWESIFDERSPIEFALEYENDGSRHLIGEVRKKLLYLESHIKCVVAYDHPKNAEKYLRKIEQLISSSENKDSEKTSWLIILTDIDFENGKTIRKVWGYTGNLVKGRWTIEQKWRDAWVEED